MGDRKEHWPCVKLQTLTVATTLRLKLSLQEIANGATHERMVAESI
jgi:hypothetical protein